MNFTLHELYATIYASWAHSKLLCYWRRLWNVFGSSWFNINVRGLWRRSDWCCYCCHVSSWIRRRGDWRRWVDVPTRCKLCQVAKVPFLVFIEGNRLAIVARKNFSRWLFEIFGVVDVSLVQSRTGFDLCGAVKDTFPALTEKGDLAEQIIGKHHVAFSSPIAILLVWGSTSQIVEWRGHSLPLLLHNNNNSLM